MDALDAGERAALRRLVDRAVRERLGCSARARPPGGLSGTCSSCGAPAGELAPGRDRCRRREGERRRRACEQRADLADLVAYLEGRSNDGAATGRRRLRQDR
ncbi:MAG TPA: hypothetical protein VKA24_14675 [Gaiellaceae bacterium]|nr:hypothetical protein [Gaiellaceae bacterium]